MHRCHVGSAATLRPSAIVWLCPMNASHFRSCEGRFGVAAPPGAPAAPCALAKRGGFAREHRSNHDDSCRAPRTHRPQCAGTSSARWCSIVIFLVCARSAATVAAWSSSRPRARIIMTSHLSKSDPTHLNPTTLPSALPFGLKDWGSSRGVACRQGALGVEWHHDFAGRKPSGE